MKKLASLIVKTLDWLACIIPRMFCENAPIEPIAYGMSVMGGLIVCVFIYAFGALLMVTTLVCIVVHYPISSCSVVIVIGMFIGIGYLRKKIGGKLG